MTLRITIDTPTDFSFYETISSHGWLRLLPFEWRDATPPASPDWRPPRPEPGAQSGVLERVEEIDGRAVLLRISDEARHIVVDIDGPHIEEDLPEITRRVRRMLQLDLDITPFLNFSAEHPKLRHVPERRQGRILRSPTLFEDVVKVICTTNTTWAQTQSMTARIIREFGTPYAPDRSAFPSPRAIASVPFEDFSTRTRLGYRNSAVHTLAMDIAEGRLDIEAWQDEPHSPAELEKRLLSLRGIGPYGAACLMLYLGKPGKVNVDSWARSLVGRELGRKVDDREVHAFFAGFGQWQGLAYHFYAWTDR